MFAVTVVLLSSLDIREGKIFTHAHPVREKA
jgi:hypothetical protein